MLKLITAVAAIGNPCAKARCGKFFDWSLQPSLAGHESGRLNSDDKSLKGARMKDINMVDAFLRALSAFAVKLFIPINNS